MAEQELTLQEAYDAALAELPPKQRKFVAEYLVDLHQRNAAIRAGYSERTADVQASQILRKLKVRAAVDAGMALLAMPPAEILARLTEQGRGSMADFLRVDEEEITLSWSLINVPTTQEGESDLAGVMMQLASQENVQPTDRILQTATVKRATARLDLMEAARRGKLGLIKKYSIDDKGKISIDLYDAQAAQQLLGRHYGLFSDTSFNVDLSTLSSEQLDELAAGVPLAKVLRKSSKNPAPDSSSGGD